MKIIVVEDDENSRIYLERALRSQKYTVDGAKNGVLAMEMALHSLPDMIISDIMMPEMDGFDLCRKVKANEQLKHIPFIFYTATFIDEKDEKLAMSLGASRFIVKPIDMDEFFKIIKDVIEEHKEKKLLIPEKPLLESEKLDEMYLEAMARKLEKKVKDLEESQLSYKALAENLPGIVYRFFPDEKSRTLFFNKVSISVTGYQEEELALEDGIILFSIIIPQDRDKAQEIIGSAIKGKRPYDMEYRITHKDGSVRYMSDRGMPVYDPQGKLMHFDGVIFDITFRKRAEEDIRNLNAQLEQRVKERTAELENANVELNRFNRIFVGRELKMIELKKKIAEYEKKLGITDDKKNV